MVSFGELSEDCVSNIILRTSPWDACRASSISLVFKSAADSDATWEQFFPANYQQILSGSVAPLCYFDLLCGEDFPSLIRLEKKPAKKLNNPANLLEIEKSNEELAGFEAQIQRDINEGMFFKNLGESALISKKEKAKVKEEAEKIREITEKSTG
ncbi:hypothetical protein LguiB_026013 [Lonicera macranthoides]